ncbi:MAG: hypothetical protein ACLFU1_05345 [Alphaproteobacteria bacterium]
MPTMGAEDMPDSSDIKKGLISEKLSIIAPDLSQRDTIYNLPWNQINVIDLSNMRGCLTSFGRYQGILDRLYDYVAIQKEKGHTISVIPEFETIDWISSKATYLKYIIEKNIPTIPTKSLCCLENIKNASIIAQPNNFETMFNDMRIFMARSLTNRFVLKPSTSSLGRGLIFIDRAPEKNGYIVSIPMEGQESSQVFFKDFKTLEKYLITYFTNTPSPDHHFLFQEYIPNIEISAVFINGTPHFIKRTQGGNSYIAHARYGGTDTYIHDPDRDMVSFVFKIMNILPKNIQNSPFLRIDVMKNTNTSKYIFSEIEGAGATRLWLKSANRVNDYIQMLKSLTSTKQRTSTETLFTTASAKHFMIDKKISLISDNQKKSHREI